MFVRRMKNCPKPSGIYGLDGSLPQVGEGAFATNSYLHQHLKKTTVVVGPSNLRSSQNACPGGFNLWLPQKAVGITDQYPGGYIETARLVGLALHNHDFFAHVEGGRAHHRNQIQIAVGNVNGQNPARLEMMEV